MFSRFASKFKLLLSLFLCSLALSTVARTQTSVTLGDSAIALTGPWRFHTGDDKQWAAPDFDDSAWDEISLASTQGKIDLNVSLGSRGSVPGWTARGYAGYAGYAWYRLRVNIQNDPQLQLAITLPHDVDDAYQIFANGEIVGQFGRFTERGVTLYDNQPRAFRLPAKSRAGPVTIAIRVWMDISTPLSNRDTGGPARSASARILFRYRRYCSPSLVWHGSEAPWGFPNKAGEQRNGAPASRDIGEPESGLARKGRRLCHLLRRSNCTGRRAYYR
jgi:hypothetical protein